MHPTVPTTTNDKSRGGLNSKVGVLARGMAVQTLSAVQIRTKRLAIEQWNVGV
jgi:hypothetical protein